MTTATSDLREILDERTDRLAAQLLAARGERSTLIAKRASDAAIQDVERRITELEGSLCRATEDLKAETERTLAAELATKQRSTDEAKRRVWQLLDELLADIRIAVDRAGALSMDVLDAAYKVAALVSDLQRYIPDDRRLLREQHAIGGEIASVRHALHIGPNALKPVVDRPWEPLLRQAFPDGPPPAAEDFGDIYRRTAPPDDPPFSDND